MHHCWSQLKNPNSIHKDIVVCSVPWTDTSIPLIAPAVLKSVAESLGKSCLAVDLNIEILEYTTKHKHKDKFIKFFFDEFLDEEIEEEVYNLFFSTAQQILSFTPEYVGLSLFSYVCQTSNKWLCYFLKKLNPDVKIVIGGPGCLHTFTGESKYVNQMREWSLIDYHIRGDAEISFKKLLSNELPYEGVDTLSWKELTQNELLDLPIPNYNDYNFDLYETKAVGIIGSRGCVRQCTFCDYIANWKKFQWRTAEHIFNEMLIQSQKYNINFFKFQDSLTNGNLKEFNKLMCLMANYNENNPNNKMSWVGYYIFRDKTNNSEKEWEIIKQSGAKVLIVGIENLNAHIRYSIGKKFSDESILFHLRQAKKHNILCVLLNIVGYINETEKDIDYIKKWLKTNTEFIPILQLQWGGTLGIFPNTYLYNNQEQLGIKMTGSSPQMWLSTQTNSTPMGRARWVKQLNELSRSLGYTVVESLDNHFILESLINEIKSV